MKGPQRLGVLAAAIVVLVVAFVILNSGGDDDNDNTTARNAPVAQDAPGRGATRSVPADTGTTTAPSKPKTEEVPTIRVENAKAVGGVQQVRVDRGEQLRFQVSSPDTTDEVHFHGYDIAKDLKAGGSVLFSVKARLPGIYEVELEGRKQQIARVRVDP